MRNFISRKIFCWVNRCSITTFWHLSSATRLSTISRFLLKNLEFSSFKTRDFAKSMNLNFSNSCQFSSSESSANSMFERFVVYCRSNFLNATSFDRCSLKMSKTISQSSLLMTYISWALFVWWSLCCERRWRRERFSTVHECVACLAVFKLSNQLLSKILISWLYIVTNSSNVMIYQSVIRNALNFRQRNIH